MKFARVLSWVGVSTLGLLSLAAAFVMTAWISGPIPDKFESVDEAIGAAWDGHEGRSYREIDAQGYLVRQPATVVSTLEDAIQDAGSPEARIALMYVLGAHPSEEASAALLGFLDSEDSELQALAPKTLEDRASIGVYEP